jgi:hypothetical protein
MSGRSRRRIKLILCFRRLRSSWMRNWMMWNTWTKWFCTRRWSPSETSRSRRTSVLNRSGSMSKRNSTWWWKSRDLRS